MSKNKLELEEIVDKNVFQIGSLIDKGFDVPTPKLKKFAKEAEKHLEKIKQLAINYNEIENQYKAAPDRKAVISLLEKEEVLRQKAIKTNTELQRLETEKNKTITIELRNKKARLDIASKEERAIKRKTKLTAEEKLELQRLNRNAKEAAIISSKLSTEYEKQSTKLIVLRRRYKDIALTQGENSKEARKLRKEIIKLDSSLKKVDGNVGEFQRSVGNYSKAMRSASAAARNMMSAMGALGGAYLFAQVMRDAFERVRDFDKSMQNLAGVYRVSRKDLAELEAQIISVAGSSVKTATEVAKLAESLATLGKTKEEIADLLEPVNNLSIGLNATSEETGEFLVQTINAFGGSSHEAEKYADVIATIRTSTSLDFQKMRDSFQYLTPISKILNKDLAHTGALVGLLADNGVKAERAGRLLGTAQQKLAKEGKTLVDALEEVNDASARGVKEVDLLKIASDLFGKQAASLGVILAQNSDKIDVNAEAIRNNGGALNDLVNEQLQSLDAHFKILNSRWEEYILNTNKSTGASNKLKSGLKFLSDNLEKIINVTINVVKWFGIYKAVMFISANATKLMVGANTLYKLSLVAVRGGIKKTIASLTALKIATATSGIGLFLVAIGSAYELFQAFSNGANDATKAQKKLNDEIENFNNAGDEYKKVILTYKKGNEQLAAAAETQFGILNRVSENLKKSRDEEYQSNEAHVREAKKLIEETTETDVAEIRKRIQIAATFSKRQEDYLVREISRYQAAEKIYKDNVKFLDAQEKDKKDKQKEANKKEIERQEKLNQDAYNLAKFRLEEEIRIQNEILENEKATGLEKLRAIQERENIEIELAELTEQHLLENKNLSSDARVLIEEKTSAKLIDIYKNTNSEIDKIRQEITNNSPEIINENDSTAEEDIKILEEGIKAYAERLGLDGEQALQEFVDSHGHNFEKIREYYDSLDDRAEESAERRKELERDLANATVDFVNALFDAKVLKIEDEITANNEKYNQLISKAKDDAVQQDLLRKELEAKNDKLEKKKRKEKRKQAIFNKATAASNIALNTAQAIVGIWAEVPKVDFGISAGLLTGFVSTLGALQLASVLATPLPKYAKGAKFGDHKGGAALVGEERPEVITEPNKTPYIVSKPTILDLPKNTIVTPSVDEYNKMYEATQLSSLNINQKKIESFNYARNEFDNAYLKVLIKKQDETINVLKNKKTNVIIPPSKQVDFEHELFKLKNIDWEA